MSGKEIIKRIENWSSGDINCLRCGEELHLFFNGGELDSVECCGLTYETQCQRIDLIISEETPKKSCKQKCNHELLETINGITSCEMCGKKV